MSERIIPQAWKERVEELKGEINWDKFQKQVTNGISSVSREIANFLKSSGLVNRTIGMDNSVETYGYIIQALGYEPMSLLGKDFAFIFDTMRRNSYRSDESSNGTDMWNRFTYYEGKPSIRFSDVYLDSSRYKGNWKPKMEFSKTRDGNTDYVYAESEGYGVSQGPHQTETENTEDTYTQKFKSFSLNLNGVAKNDLVKKTNDLFNAGRMRTMIARFHEKSAEYGPTQTALSQMFGMSHGRNLLKRDNAIVSIQNYDNPYCRVWTNYHQYRSLMDTIRPLGGATKQDFYDEAYNWKALRAPSGNTRLVQNSVLDDRNGLVKITPYKDDIKTGINNIKRCMFSIENLAWREQGRINGTYDDDGLSPEQKGPFGGRIMWFPPYNLTFDEQVSVNWDSSEFIGRGEKVYTYKNSDRTGRLSFTMLIDHPGIVDYWDKRDGETSYDSYGCIDANSNESELLRFFAGCDVLTAKPQKIDEVNFQPGNGNNVGNNGNSQDSINGKSNEPVASPGNASDPNPNGTITFKVAAYFPNNYSGVNDRGQGVDFPINYLLNGVGTQVDDSNKIIPIDMTVTPSYLDGNEWKNDCGGYEVRELDSKGISIQTNQITGGVEYNPEKQVEYFILNQNANLKIKYDTGATAREYTLVKIMYDQSEHKWKGGAHGGKKYPRFYEQKYFTRADNDTIKQILTSGGNYLDKKSFCYNSTGYLSGAGKSGFYKTDEKDKNVILISLVDLYVALNLDKGQIFDSLYDDYNVKLIQDCIQKSKLKSIVTCGSCSPVANSTNAENYQDTLANERSKTLYNWLNIHLKKNDDTEINDKKTVNPDVSGQIYEKNDVDDPVMKACRSARAEITFSNVSDEIINQIRAAQAQAVVSNPVQAPQTPASQNTDGNNENASSTGNKISRYDNEALFFKRLKKDDPFLHHLITEKVRYFDPAFHSISPEGFGARLTFLHQCTRQGPTQGTSDFGGIANNLAFGRPPVCILRIGDFYYTKIVITNLSIDYKDASWDLNQEGIGVMPMMANISISFAFLGGSDLTGPISRLQNALSFNYYANTTVYDNRAERVEYNENGEVTSFKAYFGMENKKDNNEK